MILGMSLAAFTQFHVILSLIGIVAGIVVACAGCGVRVTSSCASQRHAGRLRTP